ncbi:hypothetical protein Ae201684P_013676 [Aphanomyces euteiches]|nr:hypothetical protein Ae201684P_013676 [Aphanomyces euteiches]
MLPVLSYFECRLGDDRNVCMTTAPIDKIPRNIVLDQNAGSVSNKETRSCAGEKFQSFRKLLPFSCKIGRVDLERFVVKIYVSVK